MPPHTVEPSRWRFSADSWPPDSDCIAIGGDLEPGTIIEAYRHGAFPMPLDGELAWWSPVRRGVLVPDEMHVSRSLITRLREGKGFGRPLAETGLYPRLATQMILVGEESGRLEEMLVRIADIFDREVQIAIKRFLAVLEPALILSLAVLIGGIVFSILLGVMGMSELVS